MKYLILIAVILFFVCGCSEPATVDFSSFLEQSCDAVNECPDGYSCAVFSGIDSSLTSGSCYSSAEMPCDFVKCPSDKECVAAESYPLQIMCS